MGKINVMNIIADVVAASLEFNGVKINENILSDDSIAIGK